MTKDVCACQENEEMEKAQNKMANNKIRRLPVCDNNNKIVGMLTLGDIAQNLDKLDEKQVSITFEEICDCKTDKNAE